MEKCTYSAEFVCAFSKFQNNCKVGRIFGGEFCGFASTTINTLVNGDPFLREVIELGDVQLWMCEWGVVRHLSNVAVEVRNGGVYILTLYCMITKSKLFAPRTPRRSIILVSCSSCFGTCSLGSWTIQWVVRGSCDIRAMVYKKMQLPNINICQCQITHSRLPEAYCEKYLLHYTIDSNRVELLLWQFRLVMSWSWTVVA